MKITPDVFEAYLKCPTKCWLRATDEPSTGAHYSEWVKTQNDSYRLIGTRRLVAEFSNDEVVLSPDMENFKVAKWWLASNLAGGANVSRDRRVRHPKLRSRYVLGRPSNMVFAK